MYEYLHWGVKVVSNEKLPQELVEAYIERAQMDNREVDMIELEFDGEEVAVKTTYARTKFERIRRITGYLVGTLDRFNNAKRSEVEERVKHYQQNKVSTYV